MKLIIKMDKIKPKSSAPVSPIKIRAGVKLYFKKATTAPASENAAAPLLQKTQSFSTWYHVPTQGGQQTSGSSGASSSNDSEIELSRLEYYHVRANLERNWKDHNCTRDIDEMMADLQRSERELSALRRWKRRLGLR